MEAEKWLTQFLGEEMKTLDEIDEGIKEQGFTKRTVRRAKENLKVQSIKQGMPAKVIGWKMPQEDM
jgi:hypothetical protein